MPLLARDLNKTLIVEGIRDNHIFLDLKQTVGKSYVQQIDSAAWSCDVMVAIVGDAWLGLDDDSGRPLTDPRNWTRRELDGAAKRGIPIIPVVSPGARMPGPDGLPEALQDFCELQAVFLSSTELSYDTLLERLDEIALQSIVELRPRNTAFTGRADLFETISAQLTDSTNATSSVALVGHPGQGKTQLAVEYAYRHLDEYRVVWEVPAEDAATSRKRFGALGRALNLPQLEGQDQVEAVRLALEERPGWLLILDNVGNAEDIDDLLPRRGGHVLITSRRSGWDSLGAVTVGLDELSADEALAMLRTRGVPGVEDDLRELAEISMRIPLALEQAAAVIHSGHLSVRDYVKLFRLNSTQLLNRGAPRDHAQALLTTWGLAFQEVERDARERMPLALDLLWLCAFLGADDIPLGILAQNSDDLPDGLGAALRDAWNRQEAIALLADHSFLVWRDDGTVSSEQVSLHRTVQHFARHYLTAGDRASWATAAVQLVTQAFPDDPSDVAHRNLCERLLPHARQALERASETGTEPVLLASLSDRLGVFLTGAAQFADAKNALESALTVMPAETADQQAGSATITNHLGVLLAELGDFDGAAERFTRALHVHEMVCGPRSLEVAERRLNLGRVLLEQDDLEAARAQYEGSLSIRDQLLGPQSAASIECTSALMALQFRAGNLRSARTYLQQVLRAREARGESDHPDAVFCRAIDEHVFGDNLDVSGRERLEEVIRLIESAYGDAHPELAECQQWLADELLRDQDFSGAETAYRRALDIDQQAYGPLHWKVARDLLRLFVVEGAQEKHEQARSTLLRALDVFDRLAARAAPSGDRLPGHRELLMLSKFDDALGSLAPLRAAVGPFESLRGVVVDALGRDNVMAASAAEYLGAEATEVGRSDYSDWAVACHREALEVFEQHLGPSHRRVARSLRHLGDALLERGDAAAASQAHRRALEILERGARTDQAELMNVLTGYCSALVVLERRDATDVGSAKTSSSEQDGVRPGSVEASVPKSPQVLARAEQLAASSLGIGPLTRLADTLSRVGQLEQALGIYERVRGMVANTYGPQHPYVAQWLTQISTTLVALARLDDALDRLDQALTIYRTHYGPDSDVVADHHLRRALVLAKLERLRAAVASLDHSMAVRERGSAGAEELDELRVRSWLALGDAAEHPEAAAILYGTGLERVAGVTEASAQFEARLGGAASAANDRTTAARHLQRSVDQRTALDHDPFWDVVRDAARAVQDRDGRARLSELLTTLRQELSVDERIKEFRPELRAAIPSDWLVKESLTFLAPDGQANVIASSEPLSDEIDTEKYATVQGDLLRSDFNEYTELEFKEVDVFGERDGYLRAFEWTPPDGVRISQIQIYYARRGRGYTATATTPQSNMDRAEVELRQMLSALQIAR